MKFPIYFPLNYKKEFNEPHFNPVEVKKLIQRFGLEHGLFYHIVKIKRTLVVES